MELKTTIRQKGNKSFRIFLASILLVFSLLTAIIGYYIYTMEYKESELVASNSPNHKNSIRVMQKEEAFSLGPSKVRIYYGAKHEDHILSNTGSKLSSANAVIQWKNND
ncbi:hypothetical protein [Priestia megaterium]|uniref:hypothetical protein n=1 Tax=Priestia megaterium TaxID=1404 RepID=UPI0021D671D8|nr:hypothetical protein [Priestia megaterium]MCU7766488.1 hypothetical protein [Priestia megaterium]